MPAHHHVCVQTHAKVPSLSRAPAYSALNGLDCADLACAYQNSVQLVKQHMGQILAEEDNFAELLSETSSLCSSSSRHMQINNFAISVIEKVLSSYKDRNILNETAILHCMKILRDEFENTQSQHFQKDKDTFTNHVTSLIEEYSSDILTEIDLIGTHIRKSLVSNQNILILGDYNSFKKLFHRSLRRVKNITYCFIADSSIGEETFKPLKEHILHCGNKIQILEFQSIEKSKINFDNIFLIPDMVFMNGSITTSSLAFSMLAYLKSTQNLSGFIKPKAYLVLFSSQIIPEYSLQFNSHISNDFSNIENYNKQPRLNDNSLYNRMYLQTTQFFGPEFIDICIANNRIIPMFDIYSLITECWISKKDIELISNFKNVNSSSLKI